MGGQISVNYTDIKPMRTVNCWKVHSAVRKTTNEKVSLWIIDQDLVNSKFPDKASKNVFLEKELSSVQAMRKIIHPHVLKILEIIDKKPEIGFASEPIDNMEFLDTREMHQLDATYISYQIAETLSFINTEAHFLHLGLCPAAVLVDNELNVHLTKFENSTQMTGQTIVPSQQLLQNDAYSDNTLRPPEFLGKKELSNTSDVFLFGLFVYSCLTGKKLYENAEPSQLIAIIPSYVSRITGIPKDFEAIIRQCVAFDPLQRPQFSRVIEDQAFNSMQMKSLRYIDLILTKQAADKFKFYKGLASKIDQFSPKLLRTKILPKLLDECIKDVRFAPILLASIFQISQNYESLDFQQTVWTKIAFLSGVTDPPEVAIALLRNMWLLLKKLDIRLHKDYVYPIFFTALQSPNPKVQAECLQKVSLIIEEMNDTSIQSSLVPRLIELVSVSPDPSVSSSAMKCVSKCLQKCDNESFVIDFFPRIIDAWNKRNSEIIALGIIEIVEPLNASADILMVRVVPLLALIAGSHVCKEDLKNKYCDLIIKYSNLLKSLKEHVEQQNTAENQSRNVDPDNPFAPSQTQNSTANKAEDIFGDLSPKSPPPISPPPVKSAENTFDVFGDDVFNSKSKIPQKAKQTSKSVEIDFNLSSTNSGFGRTSSPKVVEDLSPFDFGSNTTTPVASGFGGNSTPSGFSGNSTSTGFGGNSTPSGFSGKSNSTGFGGNSTSTGFGGNSTSAGFGGNSTSTGFGGNSTSTGFGGNSTSTGFGSNSTSTGFGANSTNASASSFRDNGFGSNSGTAAFRDSGFGSNSGTAAFRDNGFGSNSGTAAFRDNSVIGSSTASNPFDFGTSDNGFGAETSTSASFGLSGSSFGGSSISDTGFGTNSSGFGNSNTPSSFAGNSSNFGGGQSNFGGISGHAANNQSDNSFTKSNQNSNFIDFSSPQLTQGKPDFFNF